MRSFQLSSPVDTNPDTASGAAQFTASPTANSSTGSSTTGTTDPVQTVSDAFLAALGSQPTDPGATVVVPTPPTETSGGSVNIKNIAILAGVALVGYFVWKKFKGAAPSA